MAKRCRQKRYGARRHGVERARTSHTRRLGLLGVGLLLVVCGLPISVALSSPGEPAEAGAPIPATATPAAAPLAATAATPGAKPGAGARDEPVFYQADRVSYDRDGATVSLEGHVEIWQGDRVLHADRVTYDRDTAITAATGNVALVDPSGQVMFADYAELGEGLSNGVLRDPRALLPQNGRLAANGARRTDGAVNELSRVIYSTCNLCAEDPSSPPLWDIRARSALQDVQNKKIEYRDAVIDLYGLPIAYFPFLAHPDPSEHRVSGLLVPGAGYSSHLGAFFEQPYYWVIDGQSDATITPVVSTKVGGGVEVDYRRVFNDGRITVRSSAGNSTDGLGGHLFTRGDFAIDDTWRWGFDINRASSQNYLRDYQVRNGFNNVLNSSVWLEGFGQGSYTRVDVRAYQTIIQNAQTYAKLPYALPRWQYSYFGEPDSLGGRFSLDTDAFNVVREQGANTRRVRLSADWQRPFDGWMGEQWKLTLHGDSAAYDASAFNGLPDFGNRGSTQSAQAMPTAALMVRYPLVRDAGSWGRQTIEPIVQLVAAPNGSNYGYTKLANGTVVSNSSIPNEDSLDQELSDTNLFALNRFSGVDRLEGGMRANVGLSGSWRFPHGQQLSGLVGEAFRLHRSSPWWVGSGLENQVSDVVSRISYTPSEMLDFTARARFDPHKSMKVNFADLTASVGPKELRVTGGFIHSQTNPYFAYDNPPLLYGLLPAYWGAYGTTQTTATQPYQAPRDELTNGISTSYDRWRLSGWARENIRTHQMVMLGAEAAYEDECFIFHLTFYKRYTSIGGDSGATGGLIQITFKTVGQFGFHAL